MPIGKQSKIFFIKILEWLFVLITFIHFLFFCFYYPLRGFKSSDGFLCWSLPLTEFLKLKEAQAFQIIMANANAIFSTLESLEKDPQEHIDEETRELLKVQKTFLVLNFLDYSKIKVFLFYINILIQLIGLWDPAHSRPSMLLWYCFGMEKWNSFEIGRNSSKQLYGHTPPH